MMQIVHDLSIKWDIELSDEYKEYLLNLVAQGYYSELYEQIVLHNKHAIEIFVKEVNEIQFKFLGDNINSWKRK